jgi:hypothetical protein
MTGTKQFINSFNLIQLFTEPNQQGKYLEANAWTKWDGEHFPGCMKPVEFFENDILQNLVEWTVTDGTTIWYRTERYWYLFERKDHQGCSLVFMTRFDRSSYKRWDSWINAYSTSVGKEWLMKAPQFAKFVKWSE